MGTIQIRNVPDSVVRTLKLRAAADGKSLQEYMLNHLKAEADLPSLDELFDKIESRRYLRDDLSAEATVNAINDAREERTGRIVSATSLNSPPGS